MDCDLVTINMQRIDVKPMSMCTTQNSLIRPTTTSSIYSIPTLGRVHTKTMFRGKSPSKVFFGSSKDGSQDISTLACTQRRKSPLLTKSQLF